MTKMTKAEAQRAWNAKGKAELFLGQDNEAEALAAVLGVVTFGDLKDRPSEEVMPLFETMTQVSDAKGFRKWNLIKDSETAKAVIAAKLREMADALEVV